MDKISPADLPLFCTVRALTDLRSGSTLVIQSDAEQRADVPLLVCCVTAEQERAGLKYNRTLLFVINGHKFWPMSMGTWFHVSVGDSKYAVKVWADACGATTHLQQQLKRAGVQAGVEVDTSAIKSKTCRRTMVTLQTHKGVLLNAIQEIGEWSSEGMLRKYLEILDSLPPTQANYSELMLAGVAAAGKVRRLASEVDSLGVDAMLEQPSCSGATDTVCRDAAAAAEGDVHGAWCTRCQQL